MANSVTKAMTMRQICESYHRYLENKEKKHYISLIGIRADESVARYQAMTSKTHSEKYITISQRKAYPVYDWSAEDVWRICIKLEKENASYYVGYNKEYDLANMGDEYGKFQKQRIGPPFVEESLRGLDQIRLEYPEMWEKMINRAEGVKTAWRYCNTGLYAIGEYVLPKNMTWKTYCEFLLKRLNPNLRVKTQKQLENCIKTHFGKTDDKIPTDE